MAHSIGIAQTVLPPFDLARLIPPEFRGVIHAIVCFDPTTDRCTNTVPLGRVTGHQIKAFARVDNEKKVIAQNSAFAI